MEPNVYPAHDRASGAFSSAPAAAESTWAGHWPKQLSCTLPTTGQGEHSCDAKYTQLYKWPGQHKEPIWPRRPWNQGRSRREPREERTSPGCARSLKNPAARVYASFRAHTWCVGRYGTFLALTSALIRCAQQSEISLRVRRTGLT